MTIGEKIKRRRRELKMSQEELANKIGLSSRSAINKIEKGINGISQKKLLDLSRVLGVSVDYLLDMEPAKGTDAAEELRDIIGKLSPEAETQLLNYARYLHQMELLKKEG